jgi:hypothetical protein
MSDTSPIYESTSINTSACLSGNLEEAVLKNRQVTSRCRWGTVEEGHVTGLALALSGYPHIKEG